MNKSNKPTCPTSWEEFLNRCSDKEAFCSWVWSIFEPSNINKQALWLYGNGVNGQTAIVNTIMSVLPNNSKTVDSSITKKSYRNIESTFGMRLCVMYRSDNKKLAEMQQLKNICAQKETTYINKTTVPRFKLIIDTDKKPTGEDLNHLLVISAKQPKNRTVDWSDRLKSDWKEFYNYCHWCYFNSGRVQQNGFIRASK